jgi:hypothetical protein
MMVIAAPQLHAPKERLKVKQTPDIALFHGPSRFCVREKLRVAKELLQETAGISMQSRPQPFFQPLRAGAQTLLAGETLAR